MKFNYLEGATPLDQDEIAALIPQHITTQEELNAWEERNILLALSWAYRQKKIATLDCMQKLHKHMFGKTWRWAGKFRQSDKNIGVSWPQITTDLKILCDDVIFQIANKTFLMDEIAVRFHHRLVWIHPFVNGNGRHARLMTDMLLRQQGESEFSWGMHQNLSKSSQNRKQYIQALRHADVGDYSLLLQFVRS